MEIENNEFDVASMSDDEQGKDHLEGNQFFPRKE